jgi:DNA-binding CsgD family transcriptional regulator
MVYRLSENLQAGASRFVRNHAVIGMGLVWALFFVCVFDYPLFGFAVFETRANNYFNMTLITALALLFFVFGIALYVLRIHLKTLLHFSVVIMAGVCFCCGFALSMFAFWIGIDSILLSIASGLLCSFGLFVLLCAWFRMLLVHEPEKTRLIAPLSFITGTLFASFLLVVPDFVARAIVLLISVYTTACALKFHAALLEGECVRASLRVLPKKGEANVIGYAVCTIALSFVYVMVGQVAISAPLGFPFINHLTIFAVAVSAVIALLIEMLLKNNPGFEFIYKIGFPVIAGGLFFVPFMGDVYWIAFNCFVVFAFYFFLIRFIVLMTTPPKKAQESEAFLMIAMGMVFGIGQFGVLAGVFISKTGGFDTVKLFSVAFAGVYLLAMGLFPLFRRNREASAIDVDAEDWDQTKKAVRGKMDALHDNIEASIGHPLWSIADEELDSLCERFGMHYHLTRREREILPYVLKGNTSAGISEKLYLSQSTVKGHMRTLYRKCDVHSRAELISAVERDRIINH